MKKNFTLRKKHSSFCKEVKHLDVTSSGCKILRKNKGSFHKFSYVQKKINKAKNQKPNQTKTNPTSFACDKALQKK